MVCPSAPCRGPRSISVSVAAASHPHAVRPAPLRPCSAHIVSERPPRPGQTAGHPGTRFIGCYTLARGLTPVRSRRRHPARPRRSRRTTARSAPHCPHCQRAPAEARPNRWTSGNPIHRVLYSSTGVDPRALSRRALSRRALSRRALSRRALPPVRSRPPAPVPPAPTPPPPPPLAPHRTPGRCSLHRPRRASPARSTDASIHRSSGCAAPGGSPATPSG
mgnify:CR=1 FL=1